MTGREESASPRDSSRTLVRRNALWNMFGLGFPLALGVFLVPRLISGMGTDRFGAMSILLTFLNYFGFFDFGIGRALTQLLAGRAHEDEKEEAALIWTVSFVLIALGAAAAVLLYGLAPWMVFKLLRIHGPLAGETVLALRELGCTLPFLLHGLALRGILEAKRRFDLSNLVRIPVGLFTFGAPLLVLPFSHNLAVIMAVILGGRVLAWLLNLVMVFRLLPRLAALREWRPGDVGMLMRFGGWFTVSNIVCPIIDSMDRVFISRFLTISVVAYYTTPYDLIVKLGILSGSVGGAIFPEFAFRLQRNRDEARSLFVRGFKYLLAIMFPCVLVAAAFAREGLSLWINPHFAVLSAPILQWLAIFVLLIGCAMVPLTFLQGAGRPDLAARMHLIELPVHAVLLFTLIKLDGIRGAAIACILRLALDFLGMLFLSGPLLAFSRRDYSRMLLPLGGAILVLLAFHVPLSLPVRAVLFSAVIAAHAWATWAFIIEPKDKSALLRMLKMG